MALLISLLAAVAYDKYPIGSKSVLKALPQFYFLGQRLDVRVEQHNSRDRSDILINLKKRRLVPELKFSKEGKDCQSLLLDAVNQIKAREYGTENSGSRELLKIACVFDTSKDTGMVTDLEIV